jgi:REP element-mobilizing transposase RayT
MMEMPAVFLWYPRPANRLILASRIQVIMPNHVHMILVLRDTKGSDGTMWASSPTAMRIPSVVRSMKTLVAKKCGFSFWQRAYHDHIIRDEAEYQKIWQYIDENPIRWHEDCYFV